MVLFPNCSRAQSSCSLRDHFLKSGNSSSNGNSSSCTSLRSSSSSQRSPRVLRDLDIFHLPFHDDKEEKEKRRSTTINENEKRRKTTYLFVRVCTNPGNNIFPLRSRQLGFDLGVRACLCCPIQAVIHTHVCHTALTTCTTRRVNSQGCVWTEGQRAKVTARKSVVGA